MNILIYGNVASGKSLLASVLVRHYDEQGQSATVLDEGKSFSPSWKVAELQRCRNEHILGQTLHNPIYHTIVTTQASPEMIYRFYDTNEGESLFDYYYHTLKKRHKVSYLPAQ